MPSFTRKGLPVVRDFSSLARQSVQVHENVLAINLNNPLYLFKYTFHSISRGMLAYVLLRVLPHRWHRWVVAGAVAMISVIGLSRIVLQVHYFSDVVAGYASGMAWLVVCIGAAEWWRLRGAKT